MIVPLTLTAYSITDFTLKGSRNEGETAQNIMKLVGEAGVTAIH